MIEINLLPEELQQKKSYFNLDIDSLDLGSLNVGNLKMIAGSSIAGLLVFILIFFSLGSCVRKNQATSWLKKEKTLDINKKEVESIDQKIADLRMKFSTFDKITKREFLLSDKMDKLSELVLPGIWFTYLYTDLSENLIIQGSIISKNEEAMAVVGNLMKNLQEDKDFFKGFSSIKLENVQKRKKEERDIVDFKIVLKF
ncbi:MAG: hypothetical protein ABH848_03475 [Candidatus Omnitrophota bacterium]